MARRSFGSNLILSLANVVAVIGVSLAVVPLLISRLGLAGYGLWVLAQSVVIYVTAAENGFGPALARFTSVRGHHGRHVRPMIVLALGLYSAVGLAVLAACQLTGKWLVDRFSVPAALHADAVQTVHLLGFVALLALLAAALGHVLDGLERFAAYTVTNALGSVAFLAWIVAAGGHLSLPDVAVAAMVQWGLVGALRVVALRDVLRTAGPLLPERKLVGEIFGFSARLQIGVLATLVNTQTDRVVIGLVASARTLGQVGIATQVAEAGRFLAYASFTPLAARMATTYGREGDVALDEMLHRYRRLWTLGVLGVVAVGVGAARPAIAAWVGDGYDQAALFAVLLLTGYGIGLLPGPAFAYLRALGRPGLEGIFGAVTVLANLGATITLGLTVGALGVVAATTAAYVVATAWVLRRTNRSVPPARPGHVRPVRTTVAMLGAAAGTYVLGQAAVAVLPRLAALVAVGAVAVLAMCVYGIAVGAVDPAALRRRRESRC